MAKIQVFEFKPAAIRFRNRIRGTMTRPHGSKILYLGAGPPKGNLFAWCEVSSLLIPSDPVTHEYIVLKDGDEIPAGYEFAAPLFANPILFVYELKDAALFDNWAAATADKPAPGPKLVAAK